MALMFLHIPRTGGSSVWHSLAGVAARQNKIIADLYHQSKEMVGHPFATAEAVQFFHDFLTQTNLCFDDDVIYHHHTYQHVPYLFESDHLQRVTLIRDPVTRMVSETFHMRRFLCDEHARIAEGQTPSEEYELYRQEYGEPMFSEMIATEVDPDALVLSYASLYRNYYLSYFSGFLHPKAEMEAVDEAGALKLAQEARQAFMWVGQFPALGDFVRACGLLADLDVSVEQDMQHVANGSSVPELKKETLEQVRAINALDYVFTEALLQAYDKRMLDRLIKLKERRLSRHESALRDLNDELARQADVAQAAQQELLGEIAASNERAEKLLGDISASNERTETLLGEIAASNRRAEELDHYKALLQAVHRSTSWRMTAPLRSVGSWIKR